MFGSLFCRSSSLVESGFFGGLIDYHSHILPKVDDGAGELSESLAILDRYEALGVERVCFTPHIMDYYDGNCATSLRHAFGEFTAQYQGSIRLHLAAEYMLDSRFEEHLSGGDLLTLSDNYLLVETSYLYPPLDFWRRLDDIRSCGYFVVLAHPERYVYMDQGDYYRLQEAGVALQCNILSLLGYYGTQAKKKAEYLLTNNMYRFIGSDLHNIKMLDDRIIAKKLSNRIVDKLNNLKELSKSLFDER
ncbi:MAG: CpsB/CapC family capsule biosynthesis tyrosine phosphatase [Rikenellaceae bacterium]